jgi:hypothetical protein
MRILKKVTPADRMIMFLLVNSPAGGNPAISKEEGHAREPLFNKLIAGAEKSEEKGKIDFDSLGTKDIKLEETEFEQLLLCFGKAVYPSMTERREAMRIEDYVRQCKKYDK